MRSTSIPSRGGGGGGSRNTPSRFMLQKTKIMKGPLVQTAAKCPIFRLDKTNLLQGLKKLSKNGNGRLQYFKPG